jgi:hypothetical protein
MLRTLRRIEQLEDAIVPVSNPDLVEQIHVEYVDVDRRVVDTLVVEVSPPHRQPKRTPASGRRRY